MSLIPLGVISLRMIRKTDFSKDGQSWVLTSWKHTFLDTPVEVHVDTVIDTEHPDRDVFDEQVELLNSIAMHWKEIALKAEKEILAYEKLSKEKLMSVMDGPRIWLGMDYKTNEPWSNRSWSFVLGVTESEDFGWHVEFQGTTHKETWAGG